MSFKDVVQSDMEIFHDTDEFGELVTIVYQDKTFENIPCVIDHTMAQGRKSKVEDHAEGLHELDCIVYLAVSSIGIVPRQGREIEIYTDQSEEYYLIEKSSVEDGELILELKVIEE